MPLGITANVGEANSRLRTLALLAIARTAAVFARPRMVRWLLRSRGSHTGRACRHLKLHARAAVDSSSDVLGALRPLTDSPFEPVVKLQVR